MLRINWLFICLVLAFGLSGATEVEITAPDGGDMHQFGEAVAISGNFALVGAPYFVDYDSTVVGKAYLFDRTGGGKDDWDLSVSELWASPPNVDDEFGAAVAISGDYAVVGAPLSDPLGTYDAGSVYIFYRNQGGTNFWGEAAHLFINPNTAEDWFGRSVAIDGDFVVVGADGNNFDTGAAYIYNRNQGGTDNWGLVKKITASDAAFNSSFGLSVSISGDYIVVGAAYDDAGGNSGSDYGAAYVFYRHQGGSDNWGEVKKLVPGDPGAADLFGRSVSISGDYVIVGAFQEDQLAADAGAAYIFGRNAGGADNWGQLTKLTASDGGPGDLFGYSVSLSGDYAVVGAPGNNNDSGAVYAFLRSGSSWSETSITVASDDNWYDYFGQSVDINGDNTIVGAPGHDYAYNDDGGAYIYESISDLALPVELASFTASAGNGHVTLQWVTASELNNAEFMLQRKTGDDPFRVIATLTGQGTTNSETRYRFVDEDVENGRTYHYRLADRDYSGVIAYSAVISATPSAGTEGLENSGLLPLDFKLYPPFPNPFNPQTTIRFDLPAHQGASHPLSVEIYDSGGRLVSVLFRGTLNAGQYRLNWNAASRPSGVYYLRLQSNRYTHTQKMMLLK